MMGADSKIEWTDHTFNPWRGCTKVAAGCVNCYAETLSNRNQGTLGVWGDNGTRVVASESMWREPIKWNKQAEKEGVRRRVFCASLADVFEDWPGQMQDSNGNLLWINAAGKWEPQAMPGRSDGIFYEQGYRPLRIDDVRRRLFALIDATPHLDWLLLTKRPENIWCMWPQKSDAQPWMMAEKNARELLLHRKNVWLGTSVATQEDADRNIPGLLVCRNMAPVLFLSAEPLLGPIDLMPSHDILGRPTLYGPLKPHPNVVHGRDPGIDWVIVGGESGPNARPMHPDWARSLRDQCQAAGVPYFFKQWGEWGPFSTTDGRQVLPFGEYILPTKGSSGFGFSRVGKAAAGRLLDGREWNEFPARKDGDA